MGLRLGTVIVHYYTGAKVVFNNSMVDAQASPVLIHQVKQGKADTYAYPATDIKALVVLPGDWLKADVERIKEAL